MCASRGIGLGLVKHLLAKQNTVVATARQVAEAHQLRELQQQWGPQRLRITPLDVAEPASVAAWAQQLAEDGATPHIDVRRRPWGCRSWWKLHLPAGKPAPGALPVSLPLRAGALQQRGRLPARAAARGRDARGLHPRAAGGIALGMGGRRRATAATAASAEGCALIRPPQVMRVNALGPLLCVQQLHQRGLLGHHHHLQEGQAAASAGGQEREQEAAASSGQPQGSGGAPRRSLVVNVTSVMASHGHEIPSSLGGRYAYRCVRSATLGERYAPLTTWSLASSNTWSVEAAAPRLLTRCCELRASKAALNAVNKALALDLGPLGVDCVLLHPGYVSTRLHMGRRRHRSQSGGTKCDLCACAWRGRRFAPT